MGRGLDGAMLRGPCVELVVIIGQQGQFANTVEARKLILDV